MIKFYKYHGAGNDFIMMNNFKGDISLSPEKIESICNRHTGVGADGIILLESSNKADSSRHSLSMEVDCFMNYYNSDGTLAEMCGNGIRCIAKFYLNILQNDKMENENEDKILNIDTRAGIKEITCHKNGSYSVNMGTPIFESNDFPSQSLNLEGVDFNFVSMGNPHAVAFIKDLNDYDIRSIGPEIENNKNFPNKINVELVQKINDTHYKVKVWERGSGETQACGTGACAVYSILRKSSVISKTYDQKEITLEFPGGDLFLSQNKKGHVILRGPAEFVFQGEI